MASSENTAVVKRLSFVVVAMFCFGFALVPLYDVFCDITGLNGKTDNEIANISAMKVDTSREITVSFLASLNEGMPWEFEPVQRTVKVHPGQPTTISYKAKNRTKEKIVGQAVPSVSPGQHAGYFKKTECFCFTEQPLEAGEEKIMPVAFVIDPDIPQDVKQLALSYTFFIKPGQDKADKKANLALITK